MAENDEKNPWTTACESTQSSVVSPNVVSSFEQDKTVVRAWTKSDKQTKHKEKCHRASRAPIIHFRQWLPERISIVEDNQACLVRGTIFKKEINLCIVRNYLLFFEGS